MFADEIYKKASSLIQKFGTQDPFEIAEGLGIMLLGNTEFRELKGLYTVIKRKRIIIYNANMPHTTQKIVCAHELGHDILHREYAKNKILQEFVLYDMKVRTEYEANMFAADLLISDNQISDLAYNYGYDMEQISKGLETDINLVGIKIANMNFRGSKFNIGISPKNNFLSD